MIDIQKTEKQLKTHLQTLTVTIGERSVRFPENLSKAANYIQKHFENLGLLVKSEPYDYHGIKVTKKEKIDGMILPSVRLSDHASFWDQGFRAVMVTDSAFFRNPHYHLPSDTMEKLDYRFMAELVESLLLFFRSHQK